MLLLATALTSASEAADSRTWTVQPEGATFEVSASDVRGWRGPATGAPDFSAAALVAAEKKRFDDAAKELGEERARSDRPVMGDGRMDGGVTVEVLSVVGSLVSYRQAGHSYTPGAAHPIGYDSLNVVDLRRMDAPPSLLDYFTEAQLVAALKADPWIRKFADPERGFRQARTLEALLESLNPGWAQENATHGQDHDCRYDVSFSGGILKTFFFHHVEKNRVAVRIAVPAGSGWCDRAGGPQQAGVLLPIPESLRAHLAGAQTGRAGFLAANRQASGVPTFNEEWEVDVDDRDAKP